MKKRYKAKKSLACGQNFKGDLKVGVENNVVTCVCVHNTELAGLVPLNDSY